MTHLHSRTVAVALCAGFALAAVGCDQRHPSETTGQKLDRATQDVAATTKDAAVKTAAALDDAALTAKVKAALFAEPGLKTLQIEVETHEAVVTLSGSVDNAGAARPRGEDRRLVRGHPAGDRQARRQGLTRVAAGGRKNLPAHRQRLPGRRCLNWATLGFAAPGLSRRTLWKRLPALRGIRCIRC